MNSRVLRLSVVFVLASSVSLFAGQGTTSAGNPDTWKKRKLSVIVATIKDVKSADGDPSQPYRATLTPLATIAGGFDPSASPTLAVRFFAAKSGSAIDEVPKDGATVLVVIERDVTYADEQEPSVWIDSNKCPFMPGSAGLVTIDGLDDKRVPETLKRIRDARAGAVPKAILDEAAKQGVKQQ